MKERKFKLPPTALADWRHIVTVVRWELHTVEHCHLIRFSLMIVKATTNSQLPPSLHTDAVVAASASFFQASVSTNRQLRQTLAVITVAVEAEQQQE